MTISTGSQVKSNDQPDSVQVARFHINHGNLCIGLAQVKDRELPEDFTGSSWAIGDSTLVRSFIEGLSMARVTHRVPSWVVNYDNFLRLKVSSDTCKRKGEVSTHEDWCGGLCLGRKIKSNPDIVVGNMGVVLV